MWRVSYLARDAWRAYAQAINTDDQRIRHCSGCPGALCVRLSHRLLSVHLHHLSRRPAKAFSREQLLRMETIQQDVSAE